MSTGNTSQPSNKPNADTRLDESPKAGETGSKPADQKPAGTAPNNAQETPASAPTQPDRTDDRKPDAAPGTSSQGASGVTPPAADSKPADKPAEKSKSQQRRENASNGNKPQTDEEKAADADKPQNSASEADKANDADKAAGNTVSKEEADRRKEAATDPNKSVNDPDFDPDGKTTNPDSPAHTVAPTPDVPLEGDKVTADEATAAGAPLGANTTDEELPAGKAAILASAKQRVAEINSALQKADPAAYKEAVLREVGNLTNGDPDATAVITKHWDNQAVVAV